MEIEGARRRDVFFYGLFMDADVLREKGLSPASPRKGRVLEMALRVGKRAALASSPLDTCYGIVMQLTHAEIDQLYSDPSAAMYRPEAVKFELADGSDLAALCFNLPVAPGPEEADQDYAERLCALARRIGLPGNCARLPQ
jgi:hypothetical protein